jgi:glutamyl-tRNA reductase
VDGIRFAFHAIMSGSTVSQALRNRFETIRRAEIERLSKKLRSFTDADRRSLEAITADIVQAICRIPERAIADDPAAPALEALVHVFALDPAGPTGSR